ncbi:hypothetical protein CFN78_22080 [Amycolatopsis antarctica]|uniref:HTH cro/C1-type domain-containing protein n=2 Tax=Amycolatopsis antarctica TaxID=1854586 RepID=A0A263CYV8_9PSEU|nr:hypothetical protein CFN78_22080 [Amycolatopsis antarctica]
MDADNAEFAVAAPALTAEQTFGMVLRTHRVAAGLTQEELSELSCLSVRAIRNMEIGRTGRPQRQSVVLLANALGLSDSVLDELLRTGRRVRPERPACPGAEARPEERDTRCELPADAPELFGRAGLVERIEEHLLAPSGPAGPAILTGQPGAGKTALAVHVAHRVRTRFPDGQIFVDAQGPRCEPMSADAVLGRVLRSLGVTDPPRRAEERSALLRAMLSTRRVIVVVDNVGGEAQVRSLLPAAARSALILVGRCPLPALPQGRTWQVDELGTADGLALLAGVAGARRVADEPAEARAIVEQCGGLPLAVRIAGCWLAARPHRGLHALTNLLADAPGRLERLQVGDLSVRSSIAAHHRDLGARDMPTVRLLAAREREGGFDAADVAALTGGDTARGQEIIDNLVHHQLATVTVGGGRLLCRLYPLPALYSTYCAPRGQDAGGTPTRAIRRVASGAPQHLPAFSVITGRVRA